MSLHTIFFYITILLLPSQLGKHSWPDWALVMGRRVDYLSPTLFLTDITIILMALSWIGEIFFHAKKNHKTYPIQIPKHFFVLILFLLFVGCNIFFATSPMVSFYKWIKIAEFAFFAFYLVKTKKHVRTILQVLSISIAYSSFLAIAQFFSHQTIGGPWWFLGERTFDITTPGIARIDTQSWFPFFSSQEFLRPYATFSHPNVLGGFLALTVPLLITYCSDKKFFVTQCSIPPLYLKLFFIITSIMGTCALILTFSRSAWIVFFCMIVLTHKHTIQQHWRYWLIGSIGVGICMLPYFLSLRPEHESVYVRHELNNAAIQMITPSSTNLLSNITTLFFGTGLGNYLTTLPAYIPHKSIFFLQPVHNIYLLLLSETGILGLVFTLFGIGIILRKIFRSFPQYNIIALPFLFLLLLGCVDHYPFSVQQGQLLFALCLGWCFL